MDGEKRFYVIEDKQGRYYPFNGTGFVVFPSRTAARLALRERKKAIEGLLEVSMEGESFRKRRAKLANIEGARVVPVMVKISKRVHGHEKIQNRCLKQAA